MSLWDTAKWRGVAVLYDGSTNLALSPLFENIDAGIEIFREWILKVGTTDEKDYIKIGIIKGIDNKHPQYYRVVFSANRELALESGSRIIMAPCRSHTMEAKNSDNVNLFTEIFKRVLYFPFRSY